MKKFMFIIYENIYMEVYESICPKIGSHVVRIRKYSFSQKNEWYSKYFQEH